MRTIQIFDTTLRDGEQSPGVNLSIDEKVEIALQLERLGVNVIEAGFSAASPGDLNAVREVAKVVRNASVCSLSRAVKGDIDAAWESLKDAENPTLHIFIATSPLHRQYKLGKSKDELLESIRGSLSYARQFFSRIEFSAEDAGRTERDFLAQVVDCAIREGAKVINLPDTVGYLDPDEYAEMFRYIRQEVPRTDEIILSAHCHDDLGMAVANSLAAIKAGVTQIEGTINGIGERAGNAAIEEVVMAIRTREDFYQVKTTFRHEEIARTSRLVSKLTGMYVPGNKAIVGENAFDHESGIHQDGVLKHRGTYEIMSPSSIGKEEVPFTMGKHSGRHAFRVRLEQLGYPQSDERINVLFKRFKELADRKKSITDEDLIALVEERVHKGEELFQLESFHLSYGSHSVPTATVRLRKQGEDQIIEEAACGNGSIDAIFKTIDRMVDVDEEVELADFRIHGVTQGKDALGEVSVLLKQDQLTVIGRGVSTDILDASARAYVDAINRLLRRKKKNQQQLELEA
ncbi:2-isopropylmalate synthase [Seinonella peptonophila]|uniref:2-isopropylmalate synthase n=1 Tax=Seinonella peptonophila TaxID=112248 RepID=A0A1M4U799_9BACL|nr:2-isopropylmalate synthase [Seinonella peptonophila]SHE52741.1 2-isopropylmalate synthase [Seinonella peptonophila]